MIARPVDRRQGRSDTKTSRRWPFVTFVCAMAAMGFIGVLLSYSRTSYVNFEAGLLRTDWHVLGVRVNRQTRVIDESRLVTTETGRWEWVSTQHLLRPSDESKKTAQLLVNLRMSLMAIRLYQVNNSDLHELNELYIDAWRAAEAGDQAALERLQRIAD